MEADLQLQATGCEEVFWTARQVVVGREAAWRLIAQVGEEWVAAALQ